MNSINTMSTSERCNISSIQSMKEISSDPIENSFYHLRGKQFDGEKASAFDKWVYDILLIAEGYENVVEEDRKERLKGLELLGKDSAIKLLTAGLNSVEGLIKQAPYDELYSLNNAKKFFEEHLSKYVDLKSTQSQPEDLYIDESSIENSFILQLEEREKTGETEQSKLESTENRTTKIFGAALLFLTLGAAAIGTYNYMKSSDAPKLDISVRCSDQQPEDMCKGPDMTFCEGNHGIPRQDMPQLVNAEVTNQFIDHWKQQDIKVTVETVPASSLKPTQGELLRSKVCGMAKALTEGTFDPCAEPIMVAQNGNVLDGHHRWAACKILDKDMKITKIDTAIENLLETSRNFKGVEKHSFTQASSINTK